MEFVVLWTDALVYLLVGIALFMVLRILSNRQSRQIWRKVLNRPINLAALVVLIVYCIVGLADTIHMRLPNQPGIKSVLDLVLAPLVAQTERSFSAPFATRAFSKEAIKHADGTLTRDYPRLLHGGKHLRDISLRGRDITNRLAKILLQTALIWGALTVAVLWMASRKSGMTWEAFIAQMWRGKLNFPWRTFLGLMGLFIFIIVFIAGFMPYYHILGTNQVGEDVLYASLKSVRTGLVIGTLTTLLTLPFAILFGIMAGYFRGWIDDVIQYVYTTLSSVPGVLLIASAVLTLQLVMARHEDMFTTIEQRADARLFALCAILGITSWTSLCRLLRGETLKITQFDFVQAAHALGSSNFRIIFKHLLPNVFHIILITVALDFSGLVLAEAVLSYVGVGVDPSTYSWGMMINGARLELARIPVVWWSLSAALIFMFVLVLAANIFADAIRDAFDPRSHYEHP